MGLLLKGLTKVKMLIALDLIYCYFATLLIATKKAMTVSLQLVIFLGTFYGFGVM